MRGYGFLGQTGYLILVLVASVATGCIVNGRQLEINTLADRLVSEYCDDCALIKITKARYVKSTANNRHDVLLVVDGVTISEPTEKQLPLGISVRHVELVDNEDLTRQLLDKMKESNSISFELGYKYAFFSEVSPPDGRKGIPVEGCIYPLMACWIGCEFYDSTVQLDEQAIICAYQRRIGRRLK